MNRTLEKKKLLPITDHITNDFAEMLQKRLAQLENHNSKLENDLKCLEENVKISFMYKNKLKVSQSDFMFQCNKLNKEKNALKLLIEDKDKQTGQNNLIKSLVDIEVQTQTIEQVCI